MLDWLKENNTPLIHNLAGTLLLLLVTVGFRSFAVRLFVRREKLSFDRRRRRLIFIRNLVFMVTIVGLLIIWARELRPFALSLLAVAVALVIATKELLQSVSGGLVNAGSQIFSIGDRIEIKGIRGDVIDKNLFTTKLLELGPGNNSHQYTGRTIAIPNSLILDNVVHCESLTDRFVVHVLTIPLAAGADWRRAEDLLLEIARAECSSFLNEAKEELAELGNKEWIEVPSADPRVTLKLGEPNKVTLLLRVPSPTRRQRVVEQRILRQFLAAFHPESAGEGKPA